MTNLEKLRTMDINAIAEWLDENANDEVVWWKWFVENYCNKCDPIEAYVPDWARECDFAYCEKNKKCRYFQDLDEAPGGVEIAKLWLEAEVE